MHIIQAPSEVVNHYEVMYKDEMLLQVSHFTCTSLTSKCSFLFRQNYFPELNGIPCFKPDHIGSSLMAGCPPYTLVCAGEIILSNQCFNKPPLNIING